MGIIGRYFSKRLIPTVALSAGAAVAVVMVTAQLLQPNKSPWTAGNPLTIGVFLPPPPEVLSQAGIGRLPAGGSSGAQLPPPPPTLLRRFSYRL